MSITDVPEDKSFKFSGPVSQFLHSMGSKEYIPTLIYDTTSPGNTIKFNYKLVKALVNKSSKSVREGKTIYRELKIFNIFPAIQDAHELSIEEVIKLCQFLKYETYKSGAILYKAGDPAEGKVYLLVSGQVTTNEKRIDVTTERINRRFKSMTMVANDIQAIANFKEKRRDSQRSRFGSFKNQVESHSPEKSQQGGSGDKASKFFSTDEYKTSAFAKNSTFSTKARGDVVGETVLEGADLRTETVICLTECEFVVIDKDAILRAKNQYLDSTRDMHEVLYNYLPGIEKLVFRYLTEPLIRLFELNTYSRGMTLIQEGDVGEYIYVVHEGDCDCFRSWSWNMESLFQPTEQKADSKVKLGVDRAPKEQLKLAVASTGSFLGEEIMFNGSGNYDYTVKVVSLQAKIFRIEKSNFMIQFPRESYQSLKKIYKQKRATNEKAFLQKVKMYQDEFEGAPTPKGFTGSPKAGFPGSPKTNFTGSPRANLTIVENFPTANPNMAIPRRKKAHSHTVSMDGHLLKSMRDTADPEIDEKLKEKLQPFRRAPELMSPKTQASRPPSPGQLMPFLTLNLSPISSPRPVPVLNAYSPSNSPFKPPQSHPQPQKETKEATIENIKKMKFDFGHDYSRKHIQYKGIFKAFKKSKDQKELKKIVDKNRVNSQPQPSDEPQFFIEETMTPGRYFTELDHDFEKGFVSALPLKPKIPRIVTTVQSPRHARVRNSTAGSTVHYIDTPKKTDIFGVSGSMSPKSNEKSVDGMSPILSRRVPTANTANGKRVYVFKTVTKIATSNRPVLKPTVVNAIVRKKVQ